METQSNRQDVERLVYENEFFMELQQVLMLNQQVSVSVYKSLDACIKDIV